MDLQKKTFGKHWSKPPTPYIYWNSAILISLSCLLLFLSLPFVSSLSLFFCGLPSKYAWGDRGGDLWERASLLLVLCLKNDWTYSYCRCNVFDVILLFLLLLHFCKWNKKLAFRPFVAVSRAGLSGCNGVSSLHFSHFVVVWQPIRVQIQTEAFWRLTDYQRLNECLRSSVVYKYKFNAHAF